eukprot:scaffold42136_cov71-Cyclotella_meneghiniana.AAC.2
MGQRHHQPCSTKPFSPRNELSCKCRRWRNSLSGCVVRQARAKTTNNKYSFMHSLLLTNDKLYEGANSRRAKHSINVIIVTITLLGAVLFRSSDDGYGGRGAGPTVECRQVSPPGGDTIPPSLARKGETAQGKSGCSYLITTMGARWGGHKPQSSLSPNRGGTQWVGGGHLTALHCTDFSLQSSQYTGVMVMS